MKKIKINIVIELEAEIDESGLTEAQKAAVSDERILHGIGHSVITNTGHMALEMAPCSDFRERVDSEGNLIVSLHHHGHMPPMPLRNIRNELGEIAASHLEDKPVRNTDMAENILSKFIGKGL